MNLKAFNSEIAAGKVRPAYLFAGKDSYLADGGVRKVIEAMLSSEERAMNLTTFYGKEPDGLLQALEIQPMFAGRRVTVVRQAETLKPNDLNDIIEYLKAPAEDACLILVAGELDKRKAFYKKITPILNYIVCDPLRGGELSGWVADYTERQGKRFDNEALGRLMAINWPDLNELASEIDRLVLMVGDLDTIRAKDIEEMGGGSFAFERWSLTDAVGGGDVTGTVEAVENLQQWGITPPQIVGDLFRLFQNLWMIRWHIDKRKMRDLRKSVHLQSFIVERYTGFARKVPINKIEDGIVRIEEADLNIKRGLRSPAIEVDLLATDLARIMQPAGDAR